MQEAHYVTIYYATLQANEIHKKIFGWRTIKKVKMLWRV